MDRIRVKTINNISNCGLNLFEKKLYEVSDSVDDPEVVLLRSSKIHDMPINKNLKAIGRAGVGVNNIPIEKCSESGVVVFNTPGANANAVKELVLAGLLLSSRNIYESISFAKTLIPEGDKVPGIVEKEKKNYAGIEISGKKLGLLGLGSIGGQVANAALSLGMEVYGYDPFLSVDAAWSLHSHVKKVESLDELLSISDFLSVHVPLFDNTRNLINKDKFSKMKKGLRLLNFSRDGVVNEHDLKGAIDEGYVGYYVTDFPTAELLKMDKVLCIPHVGASTSEAEENCAKMVVSQVKDFIANGNIVNSVNFPNCTMQRQGGARLVVANRNVPGIVGKLSTQLASTNINILNMLNRSKGNYAYNIIDLDGDIPSTLIEDVKAIDSVLMARVIY